MHLCGCRKVDGDGDKMATKNEIVESYWGKNILEGNCMDAPTRTLSGGGRMNEEIWHKIMKEYIKSYEAIKYLNDKEILSDDEYVPAILNLIEDIMVTFEREVEE